MAVSVAQGRDGRGDRQMMAISLARAVALALVLLTVLLAGPAAAFRLGHAPAPVAHNPADRLAGLPPDPERYDPATHCAPKPKPGMVALVSWLDRHALGVSWGTYRCERWGAHEASLHAENRAVDWHLDVGQPTDRREARRLIELFLAPDRAGTPHALARRMGIEEIIWDCSCWAAGMTEFEAYAPCLSKHGNLRQAVDPTIAHRNHLHIGLSKAGAARRTSFWQAAL
jgi:hypothetical protein